MTVEEEKKLNEMAAKESYTDSDCAALLKDFYCWFKPIYNKLPDFSKKKHAFRLEALGKIAERFGAKLEKPAEPQPKEDEEEE